MLRYSTLHTYPEGVKSENLPWGWTYLFWKAALGGGILTLPEIFRSGGVGAEPTRGETRKIENP